MATRKELFDKVVAHCNAQGGPALNFGGGCEYRTEDGEEKCAIGALLTPEDLEFVMGDPNLRGNGLGAWPKDVKERLLTNAGFDFSRQDEASFASGLQLFHDEEWNWIAGELRQEEIERFEMGWNL